MITFDHVTYTYEGQTVPSLRDCSFTVEPGELILFTGESGCGKTTIIKLINGLLQHGGGGTLEGAVTVGGRDVAGTPLWELAQTVGSVFQNPKSQFFNLDTTGEVLFGLESRGASREEMSQALDSAVQVCGVGPLLDRNIFALSGGEKQRIACASAWAMGPEVFVLDEPSSNLDGEGIRQLRDILRRLKAAGKTVLVAEHRLWYAADLADRVFYLREGQLKQIYAGAEFLALPEGKRRSMGLRSLKVVPLPEPHPSSEASGLTVRGLRASYGGRAVWQDVSFTAPRGQITAITGHNGAGKTTLARCLCGLMKEQAGTILWDESPLGRKERRRKAFLIMQDVNLQLFWGQRAGGSEAGQRSHRAGGSGRPGADGSGPVRPGAPVGALRRTEAASVHCGRLSQRKGTADLRRAHQRSGLRPHAGGEQAPPGTGGTGNVRGGHHP